MTSGFLLINKPSGPTSHDAVDQLRRIIGLKKIGHAGTLDPLAEGLLIMAVGREATKQIKQFVKLDKEYLADIRLGLTTDSYDRLGKIISQYQGQPIERKEIDKAAGKFVGRQEQLPPMFSAKKVQGQKLYQLARRGQTIERPKQNIEIYQLAILSYVWPDLRLLVHCSSGTYIRSLVQDLGQALGCGACLQALVRNKIGPYNLEQAVELKKLTSQNWTEQLL